MCYTLVHGFCFKLFPIACIGLTSKKRKNCYHGNSLCVPTQTALKELKSLIDEAIDNKSTVDDLRRAVLTYSHIMLCRERTDGSLRGMALLKIEHKGTYTLLKVS